MKKLRGRREGEECHILHELFPNAHLPCHAYHLFPQYFTVKIFNYKVGRFHSKHHLDSTVHVILHLLSHPRHLPIPPAITHFITVLASLCFVSLKWLTLNRLVHFLLFVVVCLFLITISPAPGSSWHIVGP